MPNLAGSQCRGGPHTAAPGDTRQHSAGPGTALQQDLRAHIMHVAAAARDSPELPRRGLSSNGLANATLLRSAAAATGGVERVLGIRPGEKWRG